MNEADEMYDRLIVPIEQRMRHIALRIVRDPNDAADVIQETLATVWKTLHKIDRDANPHAYILRICISRAYDLVRRRARRRMREGKVIAAAPEALSKGTDPAARAETKDLAEAVRDAVGLLPPKQAKAVLLRASEGTSYSAIASILGCSEPTARSHYSKGIGRLREILTKLDLL